MNKEKQIEKLTMDVCNYNRKGICIIDERHCKLPAQCASVKLANDLLTKGYRKASDVAEEIITEVKRKLIDLHYRESITYGGGFSKNKKEFEKDTAIYRAITSTVKYALAALDDIKDKYTEETNNGKND